MFRLEGQLWWYRILHERVEQALQRRFGDRRDVAILDAGCGTGGMLDFLRRKGYTNLRGVDGSADAVAFTQERGFLVTLTDLNELAQFEPNMQYDAIICNDVFCYFLKSELPPLVLALANRLRTDGVLISNNNAFGVFEGQHDIAVGIIRRFVLADFETLIPQAGLTINHATYWSFALSPLILLIRQWQQLQLKMGWQSRETAQSDVYLPGKFVNETLYTIAHAEQKLLSRTPFGSSLFLISCKGISGKW